MGTLMRLSARESPDWNSVISREAMLNAGSGPPSLPPELRI
jgi:hypothetical protein